MVGVKQGETTVIHTGQQDISKMRLRAASAALTLVVLLGLSVAATQSAQAQAFTDLYNFAGGSDGGYPYAGLVRDAVGNLYGTTGSGGSSGFGVVFKLNKKGTETVMHSFTGGADGEYPYAELVRDAKGNLYGSTAGGGGTGCGGFGCGVVFKVNKKGTETVLYSFTGGTTDGCYPRGSLLHGRKGQSLWYHR